MNVLIATNNKAKVERFKKLIKFADPRVQLFTPEEVGIKSIDVEETGETILDNACLKASTYSKKTDMPILSNDTGLYIEGEGFIDAPKRKALEGQDEFFIRRSIKKTLSLQISRMWHLLYQVKIGIH